MYTLLSKLFMFRKNLHILSGHGLVYSPLAECPLKFWLSTSCYGLIASQKGQAQHEASVNSVLSFIDLKTIRKSTLPFTFVYRTANLSLYSLEAQIAQRQIRHLIPKYEWHSIQFKTTRVFMEQVAGIWCDDLHKEWKY